MTVQQEKYTLQLAVHTGDSFALMSAHKKIHQYNILSR